MTVPASQPAKRDTLNLRIKPEVRAMIDQAAALLGKSRTVFVLEAASRAAEEALLDRTLIRVDAETFAEFQALLDAPVQPNERLRKTLQTPFPWE